MPSLRVLGRTWRVASDDFVLAGILAALHALLGYATALAALGESWVVASTGSEVESFVRFRIDILAFSHVCVAFSGLLLAYLSSRGLLWEESKRVYVPHALFLHGALVVLSILFGTFALFSVPPQRRITSALTVSAAIAAWQGVLAAMATVAASIWTADCSGLMLLEQMTPLFGMAVVQDDSRLSTVSSYRYEGLFATVVVLA